MKEEKYELTEEQVLDGRCIHCGKVVKVVYQDAWYGKPTYYCTCDTAHKMMIVNIELSDLAYKQRELYSKRIQLLRVEAPEMLELRIKRILEHNDIDLTRVNISC